MTADIDNPQEIIDDFFKKSLNPEIGARSILRALINDLNFCVGGIRYKRNMSSEEAREFYKVMPTFACISIYCTAVDLLARVSRKRIPGNNDTNTEFFKFSAVEWFNHSEEQAEHLWELRNAISHHYKLTKVDAIHPFGASLMEKDKDGFWHFNLIAMYGNLNKAADKLYKKLSAENEGEKQSTAKYINENGMFFVLNT